MTGLAALCLHPASASNCKLARIAEWPVRVEHGHLIVDGAINGQKIAIMLDTGAPDTLLFRPAAERLGLMLRSTNARQFGVGGETKVEVAELDEFRIGDAVRTKWRVYVVGARNFRADLILGEQFFRLVDIEFDLANDVVRLFQARDCEGVSLAYWTTGVFGEVAMYPASVGESQVVVPVKINGETLPALFDSGAITIVDQGEAARLGVTPESPGVVRAGKIGGFGTLVSDAWIGNFKSFTIGNETINDVALPFSAFRKDAIYTTTGSHVPTKLMASFSMLLGLDFIRAHRMLVSHSQQKLYFTYNGGPVFELVSPPVPPDKPGTDAKLRTPTGAGP
ncbi:MAG: retroviral-like aspartic protease family protein [Betaproteobacteria bacterium]